jgi:hypothetical protein
MASERTSSCVLAKPVKRGFLLTIFELRRILPINSSRLVVSGEVSGRGNLVFIYLVRKALEAANFLSLAGDLPVVVDVINAGHDVMFKEYPLLLDALALQKFVAEIPKLLPEITVYKVSFIHNAVFLKSKKTRNQFPEPIMASASVVIAICY